MCYLCEFLVEKSRQNILILQVLKYSKLYSKYKWLRFHDKCTWHKAYKLIRGERKFRSDSGWHSHTWISCLVWLPPLCQRRGQHGWWPLQILGGSDASRSRSLGSPGNCPTLSVATLLESNAAHFYLMFRELDIHSKHPLSVNHRLAPFRPLKPTGRKKNSLSVCAQVSVLQHKETGFKILRTAVRDCCTKQGRSQQTSPLGNLQI